MQYSNIFESAVYGMQKMSEGLLTPASLVYKKTPEITILIPEVSEIVS